MVKLFLVEDEVVMRDGIKKHIDWDKEEIEFVGEASDGEMAYPMILKEKPDILLTDIKMPFMDGLSLAELVRKELPEISIIILSGYDDFSYAQRAVSLGAVEYLLKPVAPSALLETIRSVKKKIEDSRARENDWSYEEKTEKREMDKNRLFGDLVMNSRPVSQCIEEGRNLNMNLAAESYRVILLYLSVEGEESDAFSETRNEFYRKLDRLCTLNEHAFCFDRSEDGFAIIVCGTGGENPPVPDKDLTALVKSFDNARYFIGTGICVKRLSELHKSYESAKRALSHRFFMPMDNVVDAGDSNSYGRESEKMDVDEVVATGENRKVLRKFLRSGAAEDTETVIDGMFDSIGKSNLRSLMFLTYITMDAYFEMVKFASELDIDTTVIDEKCGNINGVIRSITDIEKSKEYLTAYMSEVIARRDKTSKKKYNRMLHKVVDYIDENFSDSELSLNKAAAMANLSPNHFSAIFSNEMGATFIEYIISKRMEKAKELLKTTDLRSSEITYMVGYRDPHYFSHTFKKYTGMTAKEFRAGGGDAVSHKESGLGGKDGRNA
ncbi:MAG: response regulator [Eubacterium sp.]|nr:response regulator [Eubacterium sp.]